MPLYTIGDVHLGKRFRNKDIPLDKRGVREEILRIRFDQYVKLAIKAVKSGKYEAVVQLGDLFDSFAVSYEDLMFAYKTLLQFCNEKIPCYILAGNHDYSKDNSRLSAFDVLSKMFELTKDNFVHFIKDKPKALYLEDYVHLLVPYSHDHDSKQDAKSMYAQTVIYGHFDEPFPDSWQTNFAHVYTGHIHKPEVRGNITIVGSILPFTFAEDAHNSFMRTVTLDEYEKDLSLGLSNYRCYRIILRDGEELPEEKHCLQMSVYKEKEADEDSDLTVAFETFDLEQLMHEALDDLNLFEEIYKIYSEYKMSEVSE